MKVFNDGWTNNAGVHCCLAIFRSEEALGIKTSCCHHRFSYHFWVVASRPGQMNLLFNKYYVIKERSRHYFPKASWFKLKEYDKWLLISHRQQLFLFYIPCNFTIRVEIPTRVIILAMLKPVDKRESSALTPFLPLSKNCPAPKFRFMWPKGNSTFCFRKR